jgi:hypothetical protein
LGADHDLFVCPFLFGTIGTVLWWLSTTVVRCPLLALGAIGFVACEPAVVEIGSGVGFVAYVAVVAKI